MQLIWILMMQLKILIINGFDKKNMITINYNIWWQVSLSFSKVNRVTTDGNSSPSSSFRSESRNRSGKTLIRVNLSEVITRTGPIYFIGLETLPSTSNRLSDESSIPFYSSSSGSHNIFLMYQLMLIYHLKNFFYFTILSFFESKDIFFGYWSSSQRCPFFLSSRSTIEFSFVIPVTLNVKGSIVFWEMYVASKQNRFRPGLSKKTLRSSRVQQSPQAVQLFKD